MLGVCINLFYLCVFSLRISDEFHSISAIEHDNCRH